MWFEHQLADGTRVEVTRKRMRTLRLRVRLNGTVACSVPYLTTKKAAIAFIERRAEWISKSVAKVSARTPVQVSLRSDSAASHAGLTLTDCADGYSAAWKTAAMRNFSETATRFLPCFSEHAIPFSFSRLKGRAMKTLWGSCNRRTNTVTLNWALFAAPQACIDYVVLHELTHFLHLHHDKKFYGFIARYMPDYKERIKTLKTVRLG